MKHLPLLACVLFAASANAADIDELRSIVTDSAHEVAPGCAIGAFRAGKPVAVTAAGYANIAERRPIDADTLFYAASVSKQFTALAVVKLIEAGKIGLDDEVNKYIPELPRYRAPVTVRMLIHHTSGIRDSLGLLALAGLGTADKNDKETTLRLLLRQKDTTFTPGTRYQYSNGGYLLLAEIVERVSGEPFARFAKRTLLDPMGMTRSFFLNGPSGQLSNVAHGYAVIDDKFEVRDTYPRFSGSGGLMVSLNDLARYEHDIEVAHKVWTPATRKLMLTPGAVATFQPASVAPDSAMGYGGGLIIGWRKGQVFVEHGGGAEAFRTLISRLPERRFTVALLCNRSWPVNEKGDEAIEAIEGDILQDPPADQALAGRYYSDDLDAYYDLTFSGDTLSVAITPRDKAPNAQIHEFKREGRSGSYKSRDTSMTLLPDSTGRGFTLDAYGAMSVYFRRVGAEPMETSEAARTAR